jgi:hypothetical protein
VREDWRHTLNYILEETEDIHRFYSIELGWCFLTDKQGERHRVDDTMELEEIMNLIEKIKKINSYGYKSFQKHFNRAN